MLTGKATFLRLLLVLAITLAASAAAVAQATEEGANNDSGVTRTESFEMIVKAGFGRLEANSWTGGWVAFRVALANSGPPISGRLVVHTETQSGPNPQGRDFVKEIQLPTGSRQFHEIAAYVSSGESPAVRVVSDDRVIAETRVRVERSSSRSDQLEIAVVATDPTTLNNITATDIVRATNRVPFRSTRVEGSAQAQQGEALPSQPAPTQTAPPPTGPQGRRQQRGGPPGYGSLTYAAHPTVISPDDLPREFISYDPVEAVVIADAPLSQLTEEQSRALKLWVASGGLLIVTGGADLAGLRASGLDEILPVEPLGQAASAALPELTETYGRFESNDPLLILTARVRPGARALLGTDERPIVAETTYGSGIVRFVAFNPKLNPYRGWGAGKDLWTDLLLPAAESKPKRTNWITFGRRGQSGSSRWGVQSFLFHLAEVEPPSAKYFLIFLLSYILMVGPLNYIALRWMRKTDLAWLTIPAVVFLFTIVSVWVAQVSRGGSSIASDVSLVELHQREGIARAQSALLIMPSSKGVQEVSFDGRDTYVNDVLHGNQSSSASATGNIEAERAAKSFILRVPMTTWTSGLYQVRSIREGEQPMISYSSDSGSTVAVKNLSSEAVTRAVYLSAAGISEVFDLAPGEQKQVALSAPEPTTFTAWYAAQLGQSADEGQVFPDLAGLLDHEIGGDRALSQGFFDSASMTASLKLMQRPLLIGFVDRNPISVEFRGALKRHSKALYVVHL